MIKKGFRIKDSGFSDKGRFGSAGRFSGAVRPRANFPALLSLSVMAVLLPVAVFAQTMSTTYQTRTPLSPATVVAINETNAQEVIPANLNNLKHLVGVVVDEAEPVVNVSDQPEGVSVATSGIVNVAVADVAGPIEVGDLLTASPIGGVAMKATDQSRVLGIAQAAFSREGASENVREIPITLDDGRTIDVAVGVVPVAIDVGSNPNIAADEVLPAFLQQTADAISGEPVSTTRVIISLLIFLLTLGASTILVYSAVHSALISIGRNPLSKGSVYRSLIQVFAIVVVVTAVGLASAYLVLR